MSDMQRCQWIKDRKLGRIHIPGCMGAAINGPGGCTCGPRNSKRELEAEVERLKERVGELERKQSRHGQQPNADKRTAP